VNAPDHCAAYWRIVDRLTPALAGVRDARARLSGQRGGYYKRLDRAIEKRRARHGLGDGPMPLLGVKWRGVDRAETELAAAIAGRDAAYDAIWLHCRSCAECCEALNGYPLCCACGVHRRGVSDDPEINGQTWQRCDDCRAAGIEVPA
jgi:hypothetical protein